jgi:hypothetical protein
VAVVPPATAFVFVTKISERHKSTTPSAIQVKNRQNSITIQQKLDVINHLQTGERIVAICCNVIFAHASIHTIHDIADINTEHAKSGTKVFV